MAAKKAEHVLKLPAVLDLNEATTLHGKLLSMRGGAVAIDASAVERCGTQCVQVLLAAARSWENDKKSFTFKKVSDAFEKTMGLIGVDIERLLGKEIQK